MISLITCILFILFISCPILNQNLCIFQQGHKQWMRLAVSVLHFRRAKLKSALNLLCCKGDIWALCKIVSWMDPTLLRILRDLALFQASSHWSSVITMLSSFSHQCFKWVPVISYCFSILRTKLIDLPVRKRKMRFSRWEILWLKCRVVSCLM